MSDKKLRVAVIGATGYVGQRFMTLLENHPNFDVKVLVAGERSAGKIYQEACQDRWKLDQPMPEYVKNIEVQASTDVATFCKDIDLAFCAVDMDKESIIRLEESIAKEEVPVVSNNSANRWTPDVPVVIPEINHDHFKVISAQKERLGTKRGFIVTKPNCSVQSFIPAIAPLLDLEVETLFVSTYQAVSGAGRKLSEWPEMIGNVIPHISGEEEKTELEPLKILGTVEGGVILNAEAPVISSHCSRVAVQEGHLANVWVKFKQPCDANDILLRWRNYHPIPQKLGVHSAPMPFLRYIEDMDRPQPILDANSGQGMGITIGRLREDSVFDYKFTCLSANTVRGAAGGSVLTAELLLELGYFEG